MIRDICKPLIVDLLRTFDKNRWMSPKIRYASVRSKDQLIKDLMKHSRNGNTSSRLFQFTGNPVTP